MKNKRIMDTVRREAKALIKLSPWILVSLLLALGLQRADLVATSGLFQSPATSTPPTEPSATPEVPEPTATEALPPTSPPTPTLMPTATEVPATPTALPPTATFTPPPTVESVRATPTPTQTIDERRRYAEEGTDLVFEWGTLFDSVALGVSYIWLCCGVLVFLLIPVIFIVLWAASRRRKQQQE